MPSERAPINVLLRAEQSGGEVALIESGSAPGFGGPPLHHHDFDETSRTEQLFEGHRNLSMLGSVYDDDLASPLFWI